MRRVTGHQFAIVAVVLFAGGCGFKNAGTTGAGASGGSAAGGNAAGGGAAGNAGGSGGVAGGGRGGYTPPIIIVLDGGSNDGASPTCGAKTKTAAKLPPDVLIVLDRSGSMN